MSWASSVEDLITHYVFHVCGRSNYPLCVSVFLLLPSCIIAAFGVIDVVVKDDFKVEYLQFFYFRKSDYSEGILFHWKVRVPVKIA